MEGYLDGWIFRQIDGLVGGFGTGCIVGYVDR